MEQLTVFLHILKHTHILCKMKKEKIKMAAPFSVIHTDQMNLKMLQSQ